MRLDIDNLELVDAFPPWLQQAHEILSSIGDPRGIFAMIAAFNKLIRLQMSPFGHDEDLIRPAQF